MNLFLQAPHLKLQAAIRLPGSKSESNRLLLLQALYPEIHIQNLSDSDDTQAMQRALQSAENTIDVGHAGTAMRFLTAFFALQESREILLTGSSRMKERPIAVLVHALRHLGAHIAYTEKEGFPPLRIRGKKLASRPIHLSASVSSQYLSALLLIAPRLPNGLELWLEDAPTSLPYLQMTLALLGELGAQATFRENIIAVSPLPALNKAALDPPEHRIKTFIVESDWSSASYFYSLAALAAPGSSVTLSAFRRNSLQGDSALPEIYEPLGIVTSFSGNELTIAKETAPHLKIFTRDLRDTPDIAQTLAVSCFGLGIGARLTGLHTLKIKETDRVEALKAELSKLGAVVETTPDSLTLQPAAQIRPNSVIKTYNDHRMAMAFAPLALKTPLVIRQAEVVSKSYPGFWEALKEASLVITRV